MQRGGEEGAPLYSWLEHGSTLAYGSTGPWGLGHKSLQCRPCHLPAGGHSQKKSMSPNLKSTRNQCDCLEARCMDCALLWRGCPWTGPWGMEGSEA